MVSNADRISHTTLREVCNGALAIPGRTGHRNPDGARHSVPMMAANETMALTPPISLDDTGVAVQERHHTGPSRVNS